METKKLKQGCLKLMETANAVYLSTIGSDGCPYTRMMSNLRNKKENPGLVKIFEQHKEDFLIYMVTSNSSAKMQQIRNNPKVSLYLCNPSEFHGLMLGGEIEEVTDRDIKKQLWQDGWEAFWPGGAEDPEFTVIQLLPAFARGWYKEAPFELKL
jgi:general stress protein 26